MRAAKNMDTNVGGHYFLNVNEEGKLVFLKDKDETIGAASKLTVTGNHSLSVEGNIHHTSNGDFHVKSSGNYYESATEIHMNGPAAAPAEKAEKASDLPLYSLPNRDKDAGWADNNFYFADPINSIMQRVPTHEPWDQHENLNPTLFSPEGTDIVNGTANKKAS